MVLTAAPDKAAGPRVHTGRAAFAITAIVTGAGVGTAVLARARGVATADTSTSEGLLLTAAWWGAAALLAWVAATAAAVWIARVAGAWRAARWLDFVTLPAVRRLLDRALAVSIVAGAVMPLAARSAGAATAPTAVAMRAPVASATVLVRRHGLAPPPPPKPFVRRHGLAKPPPIVRGPTTTMPTTPTTAPGGPSQRPARPAVPAPTVDRGTTARQGVAHVVVRDDNLWTIAATELARHGVGSDHAAIARYWWRVIARNRAHLRSHDANLIFPGEVIWLPPVDHAG